MPDSFEAVRAEALFVSCLQSSECPAADQVRGAVDGALRRWGVRGCAEQVALEYGDHPETAAPRMAWALATIKGAYSARCATTPRQSAAALALAG
jgi:hypothetical protein